VPFPQRQRLRGSVVPAVLVAAVSLAGCSALVPGRAESAAATAQTVPTPPAPGGGSGGSATTPSGGCQVAIAGRGQIRVSGSSNRVSTVNGASSLSCGGGPVVDIVSVADGAVTFSADGAAPVRIAAGQTAAVDSYQITVSSAAGDSAQFAVVPG
jgi:hypothetical protein